MVALLGSGGMGEVYRARDPRLRRDVAIKVIAAHFATDPERLKRFEQEAVAAAAINHPHIVAVYDVGIDDGSPYLVTELLEGDSLRRRLGAGALPVEKAVQFGLELAEGIAAAHEKGIVHRDLKPENVLVGRDDRLKIADFGLAKLLERTSTAVGHSGTTPTAFTEAGQVMGTPDYMAPEQVRGEAADHRCDIFALGGILYEMLGGRRAFHRETTAETLTAVLREDPPEIRTLNRKVPSALARLVAHCLEKQASRRFQSAHDLAFALATIGDLQDQTAGFPEESVAARRAPVWQRAAAAMAAAAALAIGAFMVRNLVRPAVPVVDEIRALRLTDARGLEQSPAISPDGRSVAFVAHVAGHAQIFVRLVGGGTPLQVTRDAADHLHPRWSPDSTSLFYYQDPDDAESTGTLWEVPALGGGPRRIADSSSGADISHDGKRLVFPRFVDGRRELVVANDDGSDIRVIELEPNFYYQNVRWSLDDRLVAYLRGYTNSWDLFVVSVDRGEPRQITTHGARLDGFTWAPDGTSIILGSGRGSTTWYWPTTNLWRVEEEAITTALEARDPGVQERRPDGEGDQPEDRAESGDGTRLQQLTFGEAWYTNPDATSRGTVVERVRRQFDVWQYPIDRSPTENVQSGVRLTHQTSAIYTPSVGPDNRELVYLSDSGGHANLWVMDLATRQSRQITFETDPAVRLGLPIWSPDGAHIAYFRSRGLAPDYYVVRPDGSESRLLARNASWGAWSPDGQWLYYNDFPVNTQLQKISVSGGTPELILRPDIPSRPAVAADGTLYYVVESQLVSGGRDLEIRVARPETAPSRVLARMPAARLNEGGGFQPVLSPDGEWLALGLTDGITTNLWRLSTSTGELQQLTDFGERVTTIPRRVSWSADGRSIFAAVGEAESDVVLLEGLK